MGAPELKPDAVPALSAEGLTKYFGGIKVLEDIAFQVSKGERLAIIGPNGAGKTTLLNMINGQIPPTRGKIHFFGQDITHLPTHQRAHIGQARSFQLTSLLLKLTVLENTLLALHGLRRSRFNPWKTAGGYAPLMRQAEEALSAAGLWDRRDEPVESLAYGDQRRLEIFLCLAAKPKLLLLDEPSNGLTKAEGAEIITMINSQISRDVTVLIVAHDMELVFNVADRVMVLFEGEIVVCADCDIVKCDPRVQDIYMGA